MKKLKIFSLILLLPLFGCATVYFPLKNAVYFEQQKGKKKIAMLPFQVDAYTYFTIGNTREILEQKEKQAEGYFVGAFKETLALNGYEIVEYLAYDDIKKPDFDQDFLIVLNEIFAEFNSAEYSFRKNLDKEKGIPFDYSIGIRTKELKDYFKQSPDIFLIISPGGVIVDLGALNAATMTMNAIFTLGLNLINPTPDDVIVIDTALINAENGQITWFNSEVFYARSLLLEAHIKDVVKQTLKKLPPAIEIEQGKQR